MHHYGLKLLKVAKPRPCWITLSIWKIQCWKVFCGWWRIFQIFKFQLTVSCQNSRDWSIGALKVFSNQKFKLETIHRVCVAARYVCFYLERYQPADKISKRWPVRIADRFDVSMVIQSFWELNQRRSTSRTMPGQTKVTNPKRIACTICFKKFSSLQAKKIHVISIHQVCA